MKERELSPSLAALINESRSGFTACAALWHLTTFFAGVVAFRV
jgi:hypothetical protein